jgi:hypothetical protein
MLRTASRLGLGVLALALAAGSARSADPKKRQLSPGKVEVEMTSNDAWKVTVAVDHPDGTYNLDDEVILTVTSEQAGYLYVYNADSTGEIKLIFPNKYQPRNEIAANQPVTIPDPANKTFRFRADRVGQETFKAMVSKEPLAEVDVADAASRAVTPVSRRKFVRVAVEAMGGDPNMVPVDPPAGQDPPPDGKKPDVVIQKEKVQVEKPAIYEKKIKEWATGQTEITVIQGKGKPIIVQDKPKPPAPPTPPDKPTIQIQDKPKPPVVPDKPIQIQDKSKPMPPALPVQNKPIQVQDKSKPLPPTPSVQDKPKPPMPPEKP